MPIQAQPKPHPETRNPNPAPQTTQSPPCRCPCKRSLTLTPKPSPYTLNVSGVAVQVSHATSLTELRLHKNLITILPLEVGSLLQLQVLTLDVEDMVSPYPEVCDRGPKVLYR